MSSPNGTEPMGASANDRVREIYTDQYAARYRELYITPWGSKHAINVENLERILETLRRPVPRWLDLACGQAWHFAAFSGRAQMLGVDVSEAQLVRARSAAPHAVFRCADMTELSLPPHSFDLVTNFWAGYCYLASRTRIASLWRSVVEWISPGGALYLEILLARELVTFNRSSFAQQTGFFVNARSDDYSEWDYEDIGGRHAMTSPPLDDFLAIVNPAFNSVEAVYDGSFMVHLVATDRR